MTMVKDDLGSVASVPKLSPTALKPFQAALLEQAVARVADYFDDDVALLSHPMSPAFKPIRESLCYAALLLARSRATHVTDSGLLRARRIIDAVLERQNRNVHGASGGAFPLAWSKEKRGTIMDPDSRQIVGSLLGALAAEFALELGKARVEAIEHAVTLAARGEDVERLTGTDQQLLHTWLLVEHGDALLGEELLINVTDASPQALARRRFGDPRMMSYELWACALWRRSSRLGEWGRRLLKDLVADVGTTLHPVLHQLVGGGLLSRVASEGGAAWVNVWLTWLALGSNPLMPKAMPDPLDATLFAFPLLGRLDGAEIDYGSAQATQQIDRDLDDRHISAWFEPGLHVEACSSTTIEPGTQPLVAAFWPREPGVASLTCQATGSHQARVDGRSVRLTNPGKCRITINALGKGATRLVEDGWELPGLRLTCRGFQIGDAERTADGLSMILRPVREYGLLVFSPAG